MIQSYKLVFLSIKTVGVDQYLIRYCDNIEEIVKEIKVRICIIVTKLTNPFHPNSMHL